LRDSLQRLSGREQVVIQALNDRLQMDSLAQADLLERERTAHAEALSREGERQRWVLLVGLLGLAVLGAMVIGLARRRRMDRRLADLERARLEQDRVIAEYRIREQLARDLHDDLGVGLGALKLKSELAQRQLHQEDERSTLAELSQISNELLVNMRQIIWSMDEAQGSLADTVAHCLDHARRYLADNRIAVDVHTPEAWPEVHLPAIVRRNLFLIVKEALHNVVKHAGADRVRITFELQDDRVVLAVADNGRGLAERGGGRGRHGLDNMRKRAEALQGELQFSTEQGTTLRCTIPLPH
jgi:signal transduction histidine kinase